MCSYHGIDNHPAIDAAPSKKSVATRPKHKIFKLLNTNNPPQRAHLITYLLRDGILRLMLRGLLPVVFPEGFLLTG